MPFGSDSELTFIPSCYQSFLEKLRQARLEAGFTQVEVAQLLEKPQSYVSKCESGERRVDFVELLDFARIYQKPIDFFQPDEVD
ncbi:MAG: helix-turn-helix transcriptional regulator [Chloroflexota bacterium]